MERLLKLFYWIYLMPFRMFLKSDPDHKFHGPTLGSELAPDLLQKLHQYRMQFYKDNLPYLIPATSELLAVELQKDLRSLQLWSEDKDGQIVGSCMLTPFPFEITHAVSAEINEKHKQHLEISRLLVRKQRMGIGMKLLYLIGPKIVPERKYQGIIGICKPIRLSMFSLVGMNVIGNITLKERNSQDYKIISAPFGKLTFLMNIIAMKSFAANWLPQSIPLPIRQTVNWMIIIISFFVITARNIL
jgi:hypothetical protein